MKRYMLSHLPMAVLYGLLVVVVRGGILPWRMEWVFEQLWWILGVIIGVLIVYLDRLAYIYSFPNEQLSQQASWYLRQKKLFAALALLDSRRHEQIRLTFRSALFMVFWVPLAFFALTSTVGMLGKGVVLGVMLHIIMDSWRMQKHSPNDLNTRLFWQIKRAVTYEEQLVFLWVMTMIFVFFSFWAR